MDERARFAAGLGRRDRGCRSVGVFVAVGRFAAEQRVFFAGSGQVPIDRTNASAAEDAIQTGIRILRGGHLLGIYPEGTRSPDGRLYRGKTGIARMALETGAPVVPLAMVYTTTRLPFGKKLVRVCVTFGKPLDFSRYEGLGSSPAIRRAVTDEIMYAIMELSGLEYVDRYHERPRSDAA